MTRSSVNRVQALVEGFVESFTSIEASKSRVPIGFYISIKTDELILRRYSLWKALELLCLVQQKIRISDKRIGRTPISSHLRRR